MSSSSAEASLCEHIQREGLASHVFSDIVVSFQSKEYKLHRIILSQSSYFRSLLSGPWKESGKPRVELQIDDDNVTVEGLETCIAYLYGVSPTFTGENVVGVLAASCFLCMEELCDQCVHFMLKDLREENFVTYQQLSERHCYGQFADRIRDACWIFLCAHGTRELAHVLPKLSLQLLCRLLKSDELWVLNESERYKFAKQALLNWKLARCSGVDDTSSKKLKASKGTKKAARNTGQSTKCKEHHQKSSKHSKSSKRKEEQKSEQKEDVAETALKRLRNLWEEDTSLDASKEGFNLVVDLFTGGGIIFAYMDAEEALQARKELEDASMPQDVVNDAIWQNVLLKTRIGHVDDESDEEDEEETSDALSSSDSEQQSSDEDESENSESSSDEELEIPPSEQKKQVNDNKRLLSTGFICCDPPYDGKRRKTTGGFSWAAKLDTGMQLGDFPPFRFGAEFWCRNKNWYREDTEGDALYGGSSWRISVSTVAKDSWKCCLECRGKGSDKWKKVMYTAKLFVKTNQGLASVTGSGRRWPSTLKSAEDKVFMWLDGSEVTAPLRVAAVVQLISEV